MNTTSMNSRTYVTDSSSSDHASMTGVLTSQVSIRFHHVGKSFHNGSNTSTVLDDVCGEVPAGHIVTLVGPSGAGKSTLLSLCNLLATPDSGEVYVEEKEVRQWPVAELRRHVGLVFQTPTMFPGSALDNLSLGPKLHGQSLENPELLMQNVGLSPTLLSQNANDLSGGQKQRVALARVLANRPAVWLLDEITSALDPTAARDVEKWVVALQREKGTTVLWIMHNLEQAHRVGDYTWLLMNGRLVESAPTEEFFTNPVEEETQRFLRGELGGAGS